MTTTIKITELTNIGANLASSTVIPVVNMAGTPTTEKTVLGNIANVVLAGAGGNYVAAARATTATTANTVLTNAQPNITSVGTLTNVAVSGNASINGNITSNGTSYLGNISTTGFASITTLTVGSTANLGAVGNVRITGGSNGQILSTNGNGVLSWVSDATSYGNSNVAAYLPTYTGNISSNVVTANLFSGNGTNLTNIAGANVSGFVPNANVANTAFAVAGANVSGFVPNANVANTAFAVAAANVSGLGNIATINLDGNVSNVLLGNGAFGGVPGSTPSRIANGNSNVNIANGNGNVTITSNGIRNWTFDTTGNLTTAGDLIGPANANFIIHSNASAHEFIFGSDGTFYAPDNVVLGGNSIYIGPGANTLSGIQHEVFIASSNLFPYVQAVINNISDNGSADWVALGARGSDAGGTTSLGFTSSGFGDANYTITGNGDGYVLVQSYAPGQTLLGGGGNLVLATGSQGSTKDIIFGTGGFLTANTFGRISHANNSLELTRTGASLKFPDGTTQTTAYTGGGYGNSNVVTLLSAFGSNTITTTGNVSVGNIIGNGQALTGIAGANVSGFVPNANVANTAFAVAGANVSGFVPNANVANTAFAVAAANVSGLGNIATINLTGSNSNVLYGNGVFAAVTGGGANTGNVTFSDVTVQGVNQLNLSAGADFTANLAYVRVRSGDVASHIHMDTGNNEAYDLIVGDDQKFVQVSSTGNIIMSSYDGNISYTMTLDTTGNLNLPTNGDLNFNGGNIVQSNNDDLFLTAFDNDGIVGSSVELSPNNTLTRIEQWSGQDSNSWTTSDWATGTYTTQAGQGAVVFTGATNIINFVNSLQGVGHIYFSVNGGPLLVWDGSGGSSTNITFYTPTVPATDPTTVTSFDYYYSYKSGFEIDYDSNEINIYANDADINLQTTGQRDISLDSSRDVTITANSTSTWSFDTTGNLTLPSGGNLIVSGSIVSSGASPAPTLSGFSSVSALEFKNGNSNVTVNANSNLWKFDSTGNLTIPGTSGGFIKTVANASIGIVAVDNGTNNPAQLLSMTNAGAATSIISAYATNATIQTNATGTINTWNFDNAGNLTLPGNTFAVKYANGTQVSIPTVGNIASINLDGNVSNLLTGNGTYVAIPVVPTVGNIATINLDGSNSNVLYGNGVFAVVAAPTVTQDITSNGAMSIMLYDGNIKYNNYATVEPSTGNITGGNISTTGAVTANTANITTGNITTINSGLLQNGNSNITITSNGNVSIQAAGSNVELVVTSTGANITGTLNTTGNITGGNISTSGNVSAGNVIINGQTLIATGAVNPDYINMTTSAAVNVAASGTDLTWDVNNGSSGIVYSAGKFSLNTGKTYHILAELALQEYSANGYLLVELVDGTTNARIGSQTVTLPYNSGFNETNNPTLDVIHTPVANQDVKLRVTGGTVGLTAQLRGGGFTRMSIVQLNPTASLSAVSTISASGNIAGGNISATGNITGGNLTSSGNVTVTGWLDGVNTTFTGAIAGNVLTVTSAVDGTIARGQTVYGTGVAANTVISLQLTQSSGNAGGNGTYRVSGTQTVTARSMYVNSLYIDGDLKLAADHGVYVRDADDPYQYDNLIGVSEIDATIFIGSVNTNGVAIENNQEYKVDSNLNPGTYMAVAKVDTADQVILSSGNSANTLIRVGGDSAIGGYGIKIVNGGETLIPIGLRIGDNTNASIFAAPLEVGSILGAAANNQSSPGGIALPTYRGTGTVIANDEWGSYIYGSRYRGTINTPLPVKDGDWLMEFGATAFDGTNNNGGGEIAIRVDGVVSGTNNPSKIEFYNTLSGANTQSLGMVLDSSQKLTVTGNISANNFTGNGGGLSNVATKVEGSWTLASGTNTVSISVPSNGTYTIWVNGNIPNGIITYTATAVVTNTNVPVLGEQYGWFYEAGNALVLTSIPNQFVGTQGAISNASPYSGTTANVFTFGITNNSGTSQVVNYGYTKL